MTLEPLTTVLLVVITIFAVSLCGILAYFYFSQKVKIPRMIQDAQALWREKEIDILRREQRELAHKESLLQLESWRQQELELVRKQQLDVARIETEIQFAQWKTAHSRDIRQDAIQKSHSVIAGQITEHFVPYLPDFSYNPKDARFLGSPIDFVIFDGLDEGQIKGIVFAEIKTGASALNTRERQIRDVVQAGKIQWIEIRPQLNFNSDAIRENVEPTTSELPMVETKVNLQPSNEKKSIAKRLLAIFHK